LQPHFAHGFRYKIITISLERQRLLAVSALLALHAQAASYVGSRTCAQCHPSEFRQQTASEHARALYPAAKHPLASRFLSQRVLDRKPNYRFQLSLTPKEFLVRVFDAKSVMEIPIDWAFGAGQQAVTFVSRINQDWYLEHYFTYYSAIGRMGITPGQQNVEPGDLPSAAGLVYKGTDAKEGIIHCFRCHSTGFLDTTAGAIRPQETGVHCEACHGPGSIHARTRDRKFIRNPGKLSAAQLNELCGSCHRMPPPEGVAIDWNVSWNVRHQPVYLAQSACFRRSKGALSCLSCHQPHEALRQDLAHYNKVCGSCHAGVHSRTARSNCVDCHMPLVSPQPPLRFTNHWIGIYKNGAKLKPAPVS
jgi:hypothetical protein